MGHGGVGKLYPWKTHHNQVGSYVLGTNHRYYTSWIRILSGSKLVIPTLQPILTDLGVTEHDLLS